MGVVYIGKVIMASDSKLELLKMEQERTLAVRQEVWRVLRHNDRDIDKLISFNTKLVSQLKKERDRMYRALKHSYDLYADERKQLQEIIGSIESEISEILEESRNLRKEITAVRTVFKKVKHENIHNRELFNDRLNYLKRHDFVSEEDRIKFAKLAGIPEQYYGDLSVTIKANGVVHIYFAGKEFSTGEGHGHYALDPNGNLIYKRDPFKPRGRQNHQGPEREKEGGFDRPDYGYIGSQPVTYAWGWGTKKGYTLIAYGHLDIDSFRASNDKRHYSPGEGPVSDGRISRTKA
jgi:hypothetical protein